MANKLHDAEHYESVIIKLKDYPYAFHDKCEEYVEQGLAETIDEAAEMLGDCEIELELYYDKHHGLFGVEADAVESSCDIASPYTKETYEDF